MVSEDRPPLLARWVSLGDVLVLAASLASVGATAGKLSADLSAVTREVNELRVAVDELRSRDITPGARAAAAQLSVRVDTQEQAITLLRSELRDQRVDISQRLDRIESALDNHDRRR